MAIPNWRQKEEGIIDSPELLYVDIMKTGKYSSDPNILRLFIDNVEAVYDKLVSFGVKSTGLVYQGGHSVKRSLNHNSLDIMKILYNELHIRNIKTLFNTRAKSIIKDMNNDGVIGIVGEKNGNKINIKSKCTILATGGITGNIEMIDRYVPKIKDYALIDIRNKSSMGEGHKMAMNVGADTTHMHVVTTYASGISIYNRKGLTFFSNTGINVNKNGKRFINEINSAPCEIGEKVLLQPEKCHFKIVDNDMWFNDEFYWGGSYGSGTEVFKRIKSVVKDPPIYFGDTIEELAEKAGIHNESLKTTIEKYNQYCQKGVDLEYNRPNSSLKAIMSAPFVAIKLILIATHGCGGLRTSDNLEVLDVCGSQIKGLYACGEIVGGACGEVYLTATHYPIAMTFGYLVGIYTARKILDNE